MPLPDPESLTRTAHELHRCAGLLGALQRLTQPPQPAYLELGLDLLPQGLSSGALPKGGRMLLGLNAGALRYTAPEGRITTFPIHGRSQAALFADLFGMLAAGELATALPPGADLVERVSRGIAARGGRYHAPQPDAFLDDRPIQANSRATGDFLQALQAVFSGMARFLARRGEHKTPLVVWPEGFDLSALLFPGGVIDESRPHLNFGFAPFSAGMEFPYLYAYAYPIPEGYTPRELPAGARWNTQAWTGVIVDYALIAGLADPVGVVDTSCTEIYAALRPVLGG
jgi:hypothetical protein